MTKRPDAIQDGMKWCFNCEEIQPLRNFYMRNDAKDKLQSLCIECFSKRPAKKIAKCYLVGRLPKWMLDR